LKAIRIGAAQFENRNGDKQYNLDAIDRLTARAVEKRAQLVAFHEGCIPAYSHLRRLDRKALAEIAEPVPAGPSIRRLMEISQKHGVPIAAGLVEADEGEFYNTYVVVHGDELVARFRKLHPFLNPHFSPGDEYVVFDLLGVKFGILICYDNNLPENVRITTMLGAEVILMPHVTCCLPSVMPGRGLVDHELWRNRESDPARLRQEFLGPKGRAWLMRWLPCRAYENGIYAVFTNPVGMDDDQVRNGASMILDPFGEVIAECHSWEDEVVVALCTPDKMPIASGARYLQARRPELYSKLVEPSEHPPVTSPGWEFSADGAKEDYAWAKK
jgi:predicted amidohydrolase